ncbi:MULTISPECIES: hypothetical protein [unclassified Caballeronia]|uniref:hypothetical protein n=1 Tax=unclassified Caballeronia TaxID=2646786 RepID=UPI002866C806|nr:MULTISPECIES: hypothetical protein [unclassified Caballeronia]MDR5771494.1 hypothetical protein [Caballeronia sp. LZ002]MDR5805255.1 hypothetical protein [Caballeronia sp. LZ001]MDR5846930.1 hypothetical protein [Caballeronia sp. LZ003]
MNSGSTGIGATAPRVTELTVPEVMPLIHVRAMVGDVRVGDAPRVVHLFFSMAGRLLGYFDPYLGPVTNVQQAAVLYAHRDEVCDDMRPFDVMCDV